MWVTDGTTRLRKLDPRDGGVLTTFDAGRPLEDVAVGAGLGVGGQRRGRAGAPGRSEQRLRPGAHPDLRPGRPDRTRADRCRGRRGRGLGAERQHAERARASTRSLATVTATIPLGVGSNPSAIATGAGSVWVSLTGAGTVARVDADDRSLRSIPLGGAPTGVTVGQGRVWVSVQPGFRSGSRTATERSGSRSGRAAVLHAGRVRRRREPQLLIVSDLPLQVPGSIFSRCSSRDAIRYVLARHDYRAGQIPTGIPVLRRLERPEWRATGNPWTPATCRRTLARTAKRRQRDRRHRSVQLWLRKLLHPARRSRP